MHLLHTPGRRLGELLLAEGAITAGQLDHALVCQRELRWPIGRTLVHLGYLSDPAMRRMLASQLGVDCIDLERAAVDRDLARLINRSYARRHGVLPVARTTDTLTVAMENPAAPEVIDELVRTTGLSIRVVTADSSSMDRAFARLYEDGSGWARRTDELADATPARARSSSAADEGELSDAAARRADELFWRVLREALEAGCSDLHLETLATGVRVRFRVDGVLRRPHLGRLQQALDAQAREVISRIKILSRLDIAERRRPQDGSFQMTLERDGTRRAIDLRVSAIPSHTGESVVIRMLDRSRAPRSIGDLDLSPDVATRLDAALSQTTGIVLVTGPTGSGKSTTLYACLMRLQRPEIRILTAEDPVEYVYDELSQSQVNDEIGNSFATYLRAFLRHDPEVIMVGEIRDEVTAEMAFRAAQTGHLLLSTLHTNSAIAAVPRLLDLGVDRSLIGSSLVAVLSQRLARRICGDCRESAPAGGAARVQVLGEASGLPLWRGSGCPACGYTGFRGRLILADLWVPDDRDLALIARGAAHDEVRASAGRTTASMGRDAVDRLRAGDTTPEEILRVLPQAAIAECRAIASEHA